MGKFKVRYIVAPVLVLSLVGGVAAATINKKNDDSTVNVVSVSEADESMGMDSFLDGDGYMGILKKGSVQNVKSNAELKIDDVLVKKGDKVKQGDKLFTYDLNSMKISLAEAENTLKSCENDIKAANNELAVLKKLQPSENAPQTVIQNNAPEAEPEVETPDEPSSMPAPIFSYEKEITAKSKYVEGRGTAEEPYVFYVGEDTVVAKDGLLSLCVKGKEAKYAIFYVCDEMGTPMYARLVDANKIDCENIDDWNVNDGVSMDMTGSFSFDGGSANFASFIIQSQSAGDTPNIDLSQLEGGESYEGMEDLFGFSEENITSEPVQQPDASVNSNTEMSDEITEKDNYIFSKEELKKMISEKEKEIERLGLDKRQNEINVKKAEKTLETGAELAELDGTVTFVAKDINHLSGSGAYITITSSSGMSIASSIGEFSLSKIDIGMKVNIINYDNGNTYMGKVTSISDEPSQIDQYGNEDTAQSYYEFIVTVKEEFDLKEDGSVSMKLVNDNDSKSIELYGMFVRSEGGKNYVMVANEDNIIEKRYVTVGKKFYSLVEVTSGISKSDRIAIAYGKTKEGMKAVDTDYETILYGSSLFY